MKRKIPIILAFHVQKWPCITFTKTGAHIIRFCWKFTWNLRIKHILIRHFPLIVRQDTKDFKQFVVKFKYEHTYLRTSTSHWSARYICIHIMYIMYRQFNFKHTRSGGVFGNSFSYFHTFSELISSQKTPRLCTKIPKIKFHSPFLIFGIFSLWPQKMELIDFWT